MLCHPCNSLLHVVHIFDQTMKKNDGLSYNNYSHNYVHSLQNVIVRARKAAEFFYVGPARHCVFINVHGPPVCKSAQLSPTQGRHINFETMTCMRGTRECHYSLTVCGKACMEGFISLRITSLKEACSHPPKFLMGHIHHHWILVRLALLQVLSQCLATCHPICIATAKLLNVNLMDFAIRQ